ncbi:TRAP transporter small permease, partial [Enterococcus faecium]|uniref:TRAP transporter small permease n=1 Tax=Enterococcus faecium TaxID=1352 RepID=UPI0037BF35D8
MKNDVPLEDAEVKNRFEIRLKNDRATQAMKDLLAHGMVAVVLWQVFSRTVLGNPNTVTEELVRFGLVWFAMLSSAYV